MKQVQVRNQAEWRQWLIENHNREKNGIWLVLRRKETGSPSLEYEQALEEALCFGWIDSIVRKMDDERYCRKFTPRRNDSAWSKRNTRRVEKLIREGRMTEFGLLKVEAAKRSGNWQKAYGPVPEMAVPQELSDALSRNRKANNFFERLAATYRKQFIGWIATAKREGTKAKRLKQTIVLLERGEKLGLK